EGRGLGCGPPCEELGPRVLHRRDRRDGLVHRLAQPARGEVVDVPALAVAADLDPEVVRVRGTPERHPVTSWTSPWTGQGSSGSPVPSSAALTSARSSAGGRSSFASSASTRSTPWARISRSRVRSAWAPASLTVSGKTLTWSVIRSHTESPDRTRLRADGRTASRLTALTLVGCTSGSSRCSGFVLMGMLPFACAPRGPFHRVSPRGALLLSRTSPRPAWGGEGRGPPRPGADLSSGPRSSTGPGHPTTGSSPGTGNAPTPAPTRTPNPTPSPRGDAPPCRARGPRSNRPRDPHRTPAGTRGPALPPHART